MRYKRGCRAAALSLFTLVLIICCTRFAGRRGTQDDFIRGADISSLQAVEDYGGKFYDVHGNEVDVISFLYDNGCNYFRLRIWNNPTQSFDAGDYCDLKHTIEMAKRIKESGAKLLLDFHYSDWWADPENQTPPAAWGGYKEAEMADAVYTYTREVLEALRDASAYPDMVQIGNEIGNGILWESGASAHPETLALYLNSGIRAVRETTPRGQRTEVMLHTQTGGAVGETERFFASLEENSVTDYDLVGLSYYPYWHGTFADLKENIENVSRRFGKRVVVAETAYPFTTDSADDKRNLISDAEAAAVGFAATQENQRLVLELVMNTVGSTEGGYGVFYWEPAWLAVAGAGVSQGDGNAWENQALFDFEGRALPAVSAFQYTQGSLDGETPLLVYPLKSAQIDAEATVEDMIRQLPQTARVLYLDGSIHDVAITWDASSMKTITDTHVAFKGRVLDFDISMGADVISITKD